MPIYGDYKYYLDPDGLNHVIKNIKPCYIRVKCAEELAGKTVQLQFNNEVVTTRKVPSEAPFVVEFGVKELGTYTVTEADYGLSAKVVVDNYTMYEKELYLGSITVTVEEEFIGKTISCSNGITTKTWVADESKTHVFSVGLGTWTVSGEVEGETYYEIVNVTSHINYNINLILTPDGATVTPTSNIKTWLYCANIRDKTYTTISQVLSDSATLNALIQNSNAVNYMVRSTSWASSVRNNSNAMTYIGNNEYCADTLLDNSTWLTAICGSTYMEKVLNVKVPTMTSNTTPSGEASTDETPFSGAGAAYIPFSGNTSTSKYTAGASSKKYLGLTYKFTRQVCVRYLKVRTGDGEIGKYGLKAFKIQGSNNGTQWTDLGEFTHPNDANLNSYILNNKTKYQYYKLYAYDGTYSTNQYTPRVSTLQYYGRA